MLTVEAQKWQTTEMPSSVKRSYEQYFPGCRMIKWKNSKAQIYIVRLENKDKKIQIARFESNGRWLETISYIDKSQVPAKIVSETEHAYPKAITVEYQIINRADGSGSYLIDVLADDKSYEIFYSLAGKFINVNVDEN